MAYTKYSLTPANNNAAPPDGAPEGMLPSAVNDTMRDMMAQIRDVGDGIRGGTYTMTAPVITGGSINGTTVGAGTASTGAFTTLSVTGATTFSGATVANTFSSSGATITGGSINGTTIGATTASTGKFSDLTDTGLTSGRVIYAGTGGNLVDDADFTFNGTTVTMANDASISGLVVGKGGGSLSSNTAIGAGALSATNTVGFNVAVGANAFNANTTGQGGVAIGSGALQSNTTGNNNTATGINALLFNTTGQYSSAYGTASLQSNTTGSNNVACGYGALQNNTTNSNNTAMGWQAGYSATATGNTFIGYQAGSAGAGNYNVVIGHETALNSTSDSFSILISGNSSATGKGGSTGFIQPGGGGVFQGNNSSSWSTTSDQRLKKNIVDNTTGLDLINQIRVRNFEYRLPEEVDAELKSTDAIDKKGVQLGVIAQELAQVLPECVKTESTGVMSVDTDSLTWYLINAVKELKAEIDQLKGN
jgi:hypothetical protein